MSFNTSLIGALAALTLACPALAEIEIHDPYARSSNPMAGAAFMIIHNYGEVDDRLLSVTSDVAARTELHTHIEDADGIMRMTHLEEGMDLLAGGEIAMKRGAEHVMFMGLGEGFEDGEVITITFQFEQAGDVVVEIPVDQTRVDPMDHSDMDHGTSAHEGRDH